MKSIYSYKYPTIILQNVLTGKKVEHSLDILHANIIVLTYNEIMEIIQLYEPTADTNKMLIQVKSISIGKWQYITNTFNVHRKYDCNIENSIKGEDMKLQFRYHIAQAYKIPEKMKEQIKENLIKCEDKLKKYQNKFDINNMDINIFWSSPLFNSRINNQCRWHIWGQGYIKQIGLTLNQSKKKAYVSLNTFNTNSFQGRDQYSIVYIICHTQCFQKSYGTQKFFYGELANGQLVKIYPQKMKQMLKNKKIQLLILHTSYPYFHLQYIKNCQGIQNILLINSNPVFQADSPRYFLHRFFTYILQNKTIKDSYNFALKQVIDKYPNDETCCCYHQHDEDCPFQLLKLDFNRFSSSHNKNHKNKKQIQCCCPSSKKQGYKHSDKHKVEQKFKFQKVDGDSFNKRICQFQKGQLQGDYLYFKGFQTRQMLLGNKRIMKDLLKVFQKPQSIKKQKYVFRMFNIYSKICGDKQNFAINLANFLIRRKIFIQNVISTVQQFEKTNIQRKPFILYTLICEDASYDILKRLQTYGVNILLVSDKNLQITRIDENYGQKQIQSLDMNDCSHYIKAQKHLIQPLKDKVDTFMSIVWKKQYNSVYYPSNFDYNWIMNIISQSKYEQEGKEYIDFIRQKLKKPEQLQQYVIFMIFFNNLSNKQKIDSAKIIRTFAIYKQFYGESKSANQFNKFVEIHSKYFHLVFQYFFHEIQKIILNIMSCLVKLCFSNIKQGVSLFQATTDSPSSLISSFFKKTIQKCLNYKLNERLQKYLKQFDIQIRLQSSIAFVKNVIGSFYLYDILKIQQKSPMLQKLAKSQNIKKKYKQANSSSKQELSISLIKLESTKSDQHPKIQQKKQIKLQPQMIIDLLKPPNIEREWQQKIQMDKISQIQILFLLIINCAIVNRKGSKKYKQKLLQKQHLKQLKSADKAKQNTIEQHFQNTILNRMIKSTSINSANSTTSAKDSDYKKVSEIQQKGYENHHYDEQNTRVYEPKDFITRPNSYLGRTQLQNLILKILSKKPDSKISAVCHSLNIHLILQICYKEQQQFQNFQSQSLKYSINSLRSIIKSWGVGYQLAKYRITYNILMAKIIQKTRAGRIPLILDSFIKIQQQIQSIFQLQSKQIDVVKDQFTQSHFKLFEKLCKNKHVFLQVKPYLSNMLAYRRKKPHQQKFLQQYDNTVEKWQCFSSLLQDIENDQQTGQTYMKIFQMKNQVQKLKQDSEYIKKIGTYVLTMLNDLDNMLFKALNQLSIGLLVVFVVDSSQNQRKYLIDHQSILLKNASTNLRSKNSKNMSDKINSQSKNNFIKIFLPLNIKNVNYIADRGGCTNLILCANNDKQLLNSMGKHIKNQKIISEIQYMQCLGQITKIYFENIYICLLKENKEQSNIYECVKKMKKKNQNLVGFDFKKLQHKPHDQLKMAYMIIICIMIGLKNHDKQDFQLSVKIISKMLSIQYGKGHPNFHRKFKPQQISQILKTEYSLIPHQITTTIDQNMKEQQQLRNVQISLQLNEVISQNYLRQIKSVLQTPTMPNYKKQSSPVSRSIECSIYTFIPNFKFYLQNREHFNADNVFDIDDQDNMQNNVGSSNTIYEGSNNGQYQSRLLQKLLTQDFIRVYFSNQSMAVIIKNFKFNRKQVWVAQMLRELFFDSDTTKLENRYVKIENIECLISIRFLKKIQK